jgi:hypothetical protein
MKIDYEFVNEVKETIESILGDFSCFGKVDVQPDEDYIEDDVVYQYEVTFKYETRNAEDIDISFNICKVKDQPGYVESKYDGDFAINTWEDNWHEVSSLSTEIFWMTVLEQVEHYYKRELKKK